MAPYFPLPPSKGGHVSAVILAMAVLGSLGVLGASLYLAVRLTQESLGNEFPPAAPPAPLPPAPVLQQQQRSESPIQLALLFLHAQKAGRLPPGSPIAWRGDSGLLDGQDQNRDLSGGFYTGGSGLKQHYPMAFAMTMLSWALLEYESVFRAQGVDREVTELIHWGVDYLLRTKYHNIVFTQVGSLDVELDRRKGTVQCWMRPEDMAPEQRPTLYPCDCTHPCSDLAGEYAAAFAAASIVYRIGNPPYADFLLDNAKEALAFAERFQGRYNNSMDGQAGRFAGSGFQDELAWGAAWLYFASNDTEYLDTYLLGPRVQYWSMFKWNNTVFDWDNKWPGIQVLMARLYLLGNGTQLTGIKKRWTLQGYLQDYRIGAQKFACHYLTEVAKTSGRLMWVGPSEQPLQYPINAGFLSVLLGEYERAAAAKDGREGILGQCQASAPDVFKAFTQQRDYILGQNPMNMSYLVGYLGPELSRKFPGFVHHAGASIPAKTGPKDIYSCVDGLQFLQSRAPNPNLLYGAVVGGPDKSDRYKDSRADPGQSEPLLHVNAVFVGLLAGLNASGGGGNNLTRMWAAMRGGAVYEFAAGLQKHRTNATAGGQSVAAAPAQAPELGLKQEQGQSTGLQPETPGPPGRFQVGLAPAGFSPNEEPPTPSAFQHDGTLNR